MFGAIGDTSFGETLALILLAWRGGRDDLVTSKPLEKFEVGAGGLTREMPRKI
jgi:hypothetical protein